MKFGCIGIGNMGSAILLGALNQGVLTAENTFVFDPDQAKTKKLLENHHVQICSDLESLILTADILLLAVKPSVIDQVLCDYSKLFSNKAVISIAAGRSRTQLQALLPNNCRVLRVMPNTPAMVGEGMIVFEDHDTLRDNEKEFANDLFSSVGKIRTVDVKLMDAVTGVSGSGPAYVYMFLQALADAGVREGLPRDIALTLSSQTVLGAAKMVMETGEHPEELKDRVCSPGGTTIEAVAALEEFGLRNAVMQAVHACTEKSIRIGK